VKASTVSSPSSRRALALLVLVLRLIASVLIVELTLRVLLPLPMFRWYLRGPAGGRIIAIPALRRWTPDGRGLNEVFDPLLGWTNSPESSRVENEKVHATSHTTSQSLRGTRIYSPEKPPGVLRIEVFGDSFAFGSEVADEATYSAVLEQSLPRAEVLNFGVLGYGLDQALLRFRKEGRASHPDVVVIGFVSALPFRDTQAFTFNPKPYFVLRGGKLDLEGVPVPSVPETLRAYDRSSRIVDVWRMMTSVTRADEALDRALLVEFVAEIRASGARPVIVRYPVLTEIGRKPDYAIPYSEACGRTGATCVDTCAAFDTASARGVGLSSPLGHFNAAGHRIVAAALAEALR
jgi:hypothetical protein